MNEVVFATLIGLLVGAGGAIAGALISFLLKTTKKKISSALLAISGGILLAAAGGDMLIEALELAGTLYTVLGILSGAAVMLAVTLLIPHKDSTDLNSEDVERIRAGRLKHTGLLLAVGMAIHNLPQGIAIGGTLATGIGLSIAILLLLHNIPEGMAMAIPLKIGGTPRGRILLIAFVTALPTALGAAIGAAVAGISEIFIGVSIAVASGAMLYLTLRELLPQAFSLTKSNNATIGWMLLGIAIGGLVIWLTHSHPHTH